LLPHPFLSLALVAFWVLLVNSYTLGSLLMGIVLGITIPAVTRLFWPREPYVRSYRAMPGLTLRFLWDIVVANLSVAVLILSFWRTPRPAWIVIPLDLENPMGVATLANMITLTPGTLSARLTPDRLELLVHVLDTADPEAEVNRIKQRYERPLQEIFG
jgi:multicomponent K+:H+ antiporter subunit E